MFLDTNILVALLHAGEHTKSRVSSPLIFVWLVLTYAKHNLSVGIFGVPGLRIQAST